MRGQLLPQVSTVGDFNRAASTANSTATSPRLSLPRRRPAASITVMMTMRVYEGGAIYSQTRQAEQTVGQRPSQLDDAGRVAVQTAAQNWAALQVARAGIGSFTAAVRAAQIALADLQEEALTGTRTVLDVLVQTQQLFTSQQQLVTAEHDAALAEFNVAAAVVRLISGCRVRLYDMDAITRK